MLIAPLLLTSALLAQAAPYLASRQSSSSNSSRIRVTDALYDGQCFYPEADDDFELEDYLGRWYQVAGTAAPFTAGCTCVFAEYSLNSNGTVAVYNSCQISGREIDIRGTASPADEAYGEDGVFQVQFPGTPAPECPGPNYIVQAFDEDDGWAIVQASNFSTLFLLSRRQTPPERQIERWLNRAGRLGSNLTEVIRTNQTGCLFT